MHDGIPIFYDHANAFMSREKPFQVFTQDNKLAWYFQRYLLQKAMAVFDWELPDNWNKYRGRDYFLYCLYCFGKVAVIETDKFGVIPQACTLGGYGVFYEPKWANIRNPLLQGIIQPIIGKECELIKLQPDYGGIMDIIYYYAEQLALASQSVSVNLLNSKFAYVFGANNKSVAESFKKMFETIISGQPAAFVDKTLMNPDGTPNWQLFTQNLKEQYIADAIISDMRKIEAEFDTKIGIPNANTDKKERLVTDEVNANNEETNALAAQWKTSLDESIERVNKLFGNKCKPLAVKWRNLKENGGDENEGVSVDSRNVQLRPNGVR